MGGTSRTCSVIVCVYQNAPSIDGLCRFLLGVEKDLAERGVALEMIFAEDGSSDDSYAELHQRLPLFRRAKLIKLTRNFGATRAFTAGVAHVTGDCIVSLSADLQDDPQLIVKMVDQWLQGRRFVISERIERKDPLLTRLFSAVYYRLTRLLLFNDFPAGGFDMFLLDKQFFAVLRSGERNSNVQALSFWIGVPPAVIPYVRRVRQHGKSRWTLAKKAKHFMDTFSAFSLAPLRVCSLIGIVVALASFAYGALVTITSLVEGSEVKGWSSLMTMLAFFLGMIVLMLSIIGEYVWRILDQVRPRADYVIDRLVTHEAADRPEANHAAAAPATVSGG